MINRTVIVVWPAGPYVEWARGLDPSGPLPDPDGEGTVYLLSESTAIEWAAQALRTNYAKVFEAELFAWHTEPEDWPSPRTLRMFKKWFRFQLHTIVIDLGSKALVDFDEEIGI